MTTLVDLLENKPVFVDDRTAGLGGSFYYDPLRPYSQPPLDWTFEQLIRYPSAVLLDVGASTGCFSLLARHHPDLTVYAFEPVKLTNEVLRANVELNGLSKKVHVYEMGVSDYNGKGILHTVIANGGKGVSIVDGRPAWHKAVEDSEIDVITIDSFCTLHNISPTFIKIDVEGNEKAVLRGAKETIEKYHPFILSEYSAENADQFEGGVDEIITMLESWGYTWRNPEGSDVWAVPIHWETITNVQNMKGKED